MVGHVPGKRAVFLDRDGVLNQATVREGKSYPPQCLSDFRLLPGVVEACELLKQQGFLLIVVTNQPDVTTGKQSLEVVEAMHAKLRSVLPIDEIRACYHTDADACTCRKPAPGMLLAAAELHDLNLSASYMVGDRWRDVQAGQQAGCSCFFIDYGYREPLPTSPYQTVPGLLDAARCIHSLAATPTGGTHDYP